MALRTAPSSASCPRSRQRRLALPISGQILGCKDLHQLQVCLLFTRLSQLLPPSPFFLLLSSFSLLPSSFFLPFSSFFLHAVSLPPPDRPLAAACISAGSGLVSTVMTSRMVDARERHHYVNVTSDNGQEHTLHCLGASCFRYPLLINAGLCVFAALIAAVITLRQRRRSADTLFTKHN